VRSSAGNWGYDYRQRTIQRQCKFTKKLKADVSCHENVTQIAENGGKSAANNSKGRRKQVAGICHNLLIPFD
jgi:hypothetical protein